MAYDYLKASRLWLAEPDMRQFMPACFEPDATMVLEHLKTDASVFRTLPDSITRNEAVMRQALVGDAKLIDYVVTRAMVVYGYDKAKQFILLAIKMGNPAAVLQIQRLGKSDQKKAFIDALLTDGQVYRWMYPPSDVDDEEDCFDEEEEVRMPPQAHCLVLAYQTYPDVIQFAGPDLRAKLEQLGDKFPEHAKLLAETIRAWSK
jgi:hypothetical protein